MYPARTYQGCRQVFWQSIQSLFRRWPNNSASPHPEPGGPPGRLRRYALELGEGYLQAVFLEMFGDPVTNPMGGR